MTGDRSVRRSRIRTRKGGEGAHDHGNTKQHSADSARVAGKRVFWISTKPSGAIEELR